jgi:glycosyltransferase involved in cell wall biosynthesis
MEGTNMEINQVLPAISYGDAVSSDAIEIQKLLRDSGYSSEIYAKYIDPRYLQNVKPLSEYKGNSENILLYHFALAGLDVTDLVRSLPDIKVLIYHNITPPEYFLKYDINLSYLCSKGRDELEAIHCDFCMGIGDSEYNCLELERIGFRRTEVLPIIIDFNKYNEYDVELANELSKDGLIKFLFVGRISPHKCHEDIIEIFYHYTNYINSYSQLYLVGNKQISSYVSKLEDKIKELGLSEKVFLTGMIDDTKLASYYKFSDIFISMSEHEGFCVPLLEAMQVGLPILAYYSTGIPYTLDRSGILIRKKNYQEIAELIHIIYEDDDLRNRIVDRQKKRLRDFSRDVITEKLLKIIDSLKEIDSLPNHIRGKL